VPALPSSILEPLWVQFAALLPARHVHHPLGCHRRRIPDRLFGLELEHLAVDGCITKAPCGGQVAGPSPVDRRKQKLKRSVATDAGGIPLAAVPAPANRRDDGLLAATLDAIGVVGGLPQRPRCTWMQATTSSRAGRCCMSGAWSARSPPAASQRRSKRAVAGRWSAPMRGATSTASCAGAPSGAGWWWSSGWPWPAPSSSRAGCCAVPGLTTAGRAVHDAAPERRLAQAGSRIGH
jgi:hypothetical protein